jgi:hypothetical protein
MNGSRAKEDAFGQGRLAGVDMGSDANVAHLLQLCVTGDGLMSDHGCFHCVHGISPVMTRSDRDKKSP